MNFEDNIDAYLSLRKQEQLEKAKIIFDLILDYFSFFSDKLINILDIGSGLSFILDFLNKSRLNYNYLGIEPNFNFCDYVIKHYKADHIKIINKKFEDININDLNNFDLIISISSLHLIDINSYSSIIKSLKKNGYLIISLLNNSKNKQDIIDFFKNNLEFIKSINQTNDEIFVFKKMTN